MKLNILLKSLSIVISFLAIEAVANAETVYCPTQIICTARNACTTNGDNGFQNWYLETYFTPGTYGFSMVGSLNTEHKIVCLYRQVSQVSLPLVISSNNLYYPTGPNWNESSNNLSRCGGSTIFTMPQECAFSTTPSKKKDK